MKLKNLIKKLIKQINLLTKKNKLYNKNKILIMKKFLIILKKIYNNNSIKRQINTIAQLKI